MPNNDELIQSLYAGLQSLADESFPKHCSNCGRTFETVDEFLVETQRVRNISGLKQSIDDDEKTIVELYRNCPCGSTLMDFFQDRRDLSLKGQTRREKFDAILQKLTNLGVEKELARNELLNMMRGNKSELIQKYIKKIVA